MIRKYIIVADDSIKGFDKEIVRLEREWGAEEIEPSEDCISRTEALDAIEKEKKGWEGSERYAIDECHNRITELSSVTPQQTRWISVSETLPPRDENVLAYHRNESFDYQYVSWIDDYSGKWAGFIGNLPDNVLAWMPLPEPYKGGDEEE